MIKIIDNKYYGWNGYQWVFMGKVSQDSGIANLEVYKNEN